MRDANLALDMFCHTSHLAASAEPKGAAASLADASAEGDETEKLGRPKPSLLQVMQGQGARPWNVPVAVERGFEIPIAITDLCSPPQTGCFKRLGMDVVVNAVWLASFWAKEEGNHEAVSALKALI